MVSVSFLSTHCLIYLIQGPILPGAHSIERYLIEEQLYIIVYSNFLERKDWYELTISHGSPCKVHEEIKNAQMVT